MNNGNFDAAVKKILSRICLAGVLLIGAAACASENGAHNNNDQPQSSEPDAGARGFAYAKENCSACHGVMPGDSRSPNLLAPAFQSIADRPDMSRMALSALLQTPHRTMPNFIIDPDSIDDLSAYIEVLGE